MAAPDFQVSVFTVKSSLWIYFHIFLVWTSCYITSVTGDGEQVIGSSQAVLAKVGDDVVLPCHIEPSVSAARLTVEWSRPELKLDFVHLLQDGREQPDVPNHFYKRRTSLFHEELPHGNISLKLSRVQLSDDGTFKCNVPTLRSSSLIQLTVEDITKTDKNGRKTEGGLTGGASAVIAIIVTVILVAAILGCLYWKGCLDFSWKKKNKPGQEEETLDGQDQNDIGLLNVKDEEYELTSKPTGLCLIMCNEIFDIGKPRVGTKMDAANVACTFSLLGFRVFMCKDQTMRQMKTSLKCFSSLEDPTELQNANVKEWCQTEKEFTDLNPDDPPQHGDAFVCCISSYGVIDGFNGTDEEPIYVDYITTTFNGENCSVLLNKPKVFFIECYKRDRGLKDTVHVDNDFLVAMASRENYDFYKDTTGSYFTQCVCKQLEESCPRREDLMTILHKANQQVMQMERPQGCDKKQIPAIRTNTLTKALVFSQISD